MCIVPLVVIVGVLVFFAAWTWAINKYTGATRLTFPIYATSWAKYLPNALETAEADGVEEEAGFRRETETHVDVAHRMEYRLAIDRDGEERVIIAPKRQRLEEKARSPKVNV